jgi:PAS domain S-box-containing protein
MNNNLNGSRKTDEEKELSFSSSNEINGTSPEDYKKLVEELGAHRVELDMQAEALARAQEELFASRSLYRDLYDSAPIGYFSYDKEGVIVESNLTFSKMTGLSRKNVKGKPFIFFLKPEYHDNFIAHIRAVFGRKESNSMETVLKNESGAEVFARITSYPILDETGDVKYCRATLADITEYKMHEKEFDDSRSEIEGMLHSGGALSQTLFKQILEINTFGFAFVDNNLHIQQFNEIFKKYAVHPEEGMNRPLSEIIPETMGLESIFKEIIGGTRNYFTIKYLRRDTLPEKEEYFDIHIFPTESKELPLLFLIKDKTLEAQDKQRIIQQQNELILSQGGSAQLDFISENIIGTSQPIERIKEMINQVRRFPNVTILLQGESGTGKNLVAKVIHFSSQADKSPFVEVNCAALPENLLESELFGHEKGAFTNAVSAKRGLLEEADKGTLFLDEISEIPLNLQTKLLSFLETRKFRPLGSTKEKEVDIRLIAASNRSLQDMVKQGTFREDLFYRLNVVKIDMAPLRDLEYDIILIGMRFIDFFNIKFNRSIRGFTKEAKKKLLNYKWPGNVRELRNVIERAFIFAKGLYIDADDLVVNQAPQEEKEESFLDSIKMPEEGLSLTDLEKKILSEALRISRGNQSKAAELLRISRETLRYRIEKYNLK